MEPATEKQVVFANKLGIKSPEQFSKLALKEMIDKALNKDKPQPTQAPSSPATATIVINRTEKPHSYEFGKAGARHKIYYGFITELREHIDALKQAGLVEDDYDPVASEEVKPEEFVG